MVYIYRLYILCTNVIFYGDNLKASTRNLFLITDDLCLVLMFKQQSNKKYLGQMVVFILGTFEKNIFLLKKKSR